MKKKRMRWGALLLALALCLPGSTAGAAETDDGPVMRIGIYYGSDALPTANLDNSVGSGYNFGYFDGEKNFVSLGYTDKRQISVLKTQNIYLKSDGTYTDEAPAQAGSVVGCYHIQLPGEYEAFDAAQTAASAVPGGFVAWINGVYQVRAGAHATAADASAALSALGIEGAKILGTSAYAVSVAATKTTNILFQFDGGETNALVIMPAQEGGLLSDEPLLDAPPTQTWFKGYKYYGAFRYERIGGGNLTVVNFVPMELYLKGVLPYEVNTSWPIEALKAQAVCARTYAEMSYNKHRKHNFDLCTTDDCQVYRGTNSAKESTDSAVDETRGMRVWYDGKLAETYYFSCDGGGTENVENVWISKLPYLRGVIDPYEPLEMGNTSYYNWTYTFTKAQLREKLAARGYQLAELRDVYVSERTPTDNVYALTFVDVNGKSQTIYKDSIRILLGVRSIRFTIAGGVGGYSINGARTVNDLTGVYAIDGTGTVAPVSGTPYAITSGGTEKMMPATGTDSFVVTGSGQGHQVGMSQWGAYSMAKQGYNYQDILTFYYTGIEIY